MNTDSIDNLSSEQLFLGVNADRVLEAKGAFSMILCLGRIQIFLAKFGGALVTRVRQFTGKKSSIW
ncbi:hypothetical protein C3R74_03270 [Acidithiobacillus ferridurans]|uniref:hypothetical protein n=1 Tax=Acidithiobacillus ferridurans TaxID=1232575 RepID=UPI000DE5719B|nr:hypothetical protein [Acidithiobacillus ferridurans]RBM03678.1 hypothetical protein C3R74_03270 [Acidithiobacillus ferridurans]